MGKVLVASVSLLLLGSVHSSAVPSINRRASAPAVQSGNSWVVDDAYTFSHSTEFTFTGSSLPDGLSASDYTVGSTPLAHIFLPSNVIVSGGFVQLKVPGGQTASPIQSSEISTDVTDILYASVRTTAILGEAAGTCNGMFFYKSDSQEMDIEWLSDPNSESNPGDGSRLLFYTNQAVDGNPADETTTTGPSPSDATTATHEYRLDWVPGAVMYYLDGVLQATLTTNVPTQPGPWIWNNWSSGDKGWTVGPPATDNIFKISDIVMYYNTTS